MLEMSEPWNVCQGEWHRGSGNSPRQRTVLQSAKLEGWVHVSPLVLDKELQELGVCSTLFLSGFGAVFPRFATMPLFGMVLYTLCHCILEAWNLISFSILQRVTIKRLPQASDETLRLCKAVGMSQVGLNALYIIV